MQKKLKESFFVVENIVPEKWQFQVAIFFFHELQLITVIFIYRNKSTKISLQCSFQKGVWDFLYFDYLWKKLN